MTNTDTTPDEIDIQQDIIDALRQAMAAGEDIDLVAMAIQCDLDESMKRVRQFVINGQIATDKEWKSALRVANINRELGFYLSTAE